MSKLQDFIRRYALHQEQTGQFASEFASLIADRSFTLDDRWYVFVNASDDLKTRDSWIWRPNAIPGRDWFEDVGIDQRGERVSTAEMVDCIEDWSPAWATPELIVALKEEILQLNLGSWCYDW